MSLTTFVGEQLRSALRSRGWIVEKPEPQNDARARRGRLLRSLGVGTVLDVGANAGRYGRQLRAFGYTRRIVSFEPLSGPQAELRAAAAASPPWEVRQLAVSDVDGEAEINVAPDDVWSSLLPSSDRAATPKVAATSTEAVRTARLDSLDELDETPTWLKLDVQGFELHALRGAQQSLARIVGIECEMSVEPFYDGQPTIPDVVNVLDGHGFHLVAVDNGHVRQDTGCAMWIDGVFVRDNAR
jgi:FkbM family methyltransferase